MHKVMREGSLIEINNRLPILPLKDVVIFPYMIYPLLVGRESSLKAVEESMLLDKHIFLAAQKSVAIEEPKKGDLYRTGVVARVLQVVKLPNGLMKVLVEGIIRGKIKRFLTLDDHLQGQIDLISESEKVTPRIKAKGRRVSSLFKEYVRLNRNIPDEIMMTIERIDQPQRLAKVHHWHLRTARSASAAGPAFAEAVTLEGSRTGERRASGPTSRAVTGSMERWEPGVEVMGGARGRKPGPAS